MDSVASALPCLVEPTSFSLDKRWGNFCLPEITFILSSEENNVEITKKIGNNLDITQKKI